MPGGIQNQYLIQLKRHFDKMVGHCILSPYEDMIRIHHFPFLETNCRIKVRIGYGFNRSILTKLRVFIARYTSFMISCGLLCDLIPKCHLALLIGLPRWVFSVVGLIPSTTARSRNAEYRKRSRYRI